MLGKLTGEDKADSGLDLARSKSGLLVHTGELQKYGFWRNFMSKDIQKMRGIVKRFTRGNGKVTPRPEPRWALLEI